MRHTWTPQDPLDLRLLREHFPSGAQAQGELGQADMPRLAGLGIALQGPLRFEASLEGPAGDEIRLQAQASLASPCGRCLAPVASEQTITAHYQLFQTAAEADAQLDLESDLDPISSEDGISLASLIEDELILALTDPLQHSDCSLPEQARDPGASPFAALAGLAAQIKPKAS